MLDLLRMCSIRTGSPVSCMHALEHRAVHVDGAHVMAAALLAAGAHLAQRAAGECPGPRPGGWRYG
jgi:hypothetical protein